MTQPTANLITVTLVSPRGVRVEFTTEAPENRYHVMSHLEREARKAVKVDLPYHAMGVKLLQGYATVSLGFLSNESWLCRIDTHAERGTDLDANAYLDRQWGEGFHKRFDA